MLIRASTSRCRSFAAAYSAFSRRSPSSRARLISFGSSSLSSRSRAAISSSNFLMSRSFIVSGRKTSWYHSVMLRPLKPVTSRQNPIVARYRAAARGDAGGPMLLDGIHLVDAALDAGIRLEHVAVAASAESRREVRALVTRLERAEVAVAAVSQPVMDALSPV